ncbi:MAG: putative transcriptional regulator [Planctomycetota bacterium]|jgi:putative transcriptional regulator
MADDLQVSAGTLLVSAPDMLDPNFMHTVTVMCEHTEAGAFGLVVNKRSSLTVDRLLPDHPVLGELELPVAWGGPVQNDTLQILHCYPGAIPGSYEMAQGVYLGGQLEDVAKVLGSSTSTEVHSGIRFILGSAGWEAGQLEAEIAGGAWVPSAMNAHLIFGMDRGGPNDQEETWQHALRSLGPDGEGLASMPPDIGWN